MRLKKPALTFGVSHWFHIPWRRGAKPSLNNAGLEPIRDALRSALGHDDGPLASQLRHRIDGAPTAEALWFLRGDVMLCLAQRLGERAAREQIRALDRVFQGRYPEFWGSQPPEPSAVRMH